MRVFVVRHAAPQASPVVDPKMWSLSVAGRSAAADLRGRLPASGLWVSSSEVRAYETLTLARPPRTLTVTQDCRFDEVHRVEPFDDDFKARRRAWVQGCLDERHSGWETPSEAAARFDAAVSELVLKSSPLVVGTHGMVLVAWLLHARRAIDQVDAGEFWESMTFPQVIEVEAD